MEMAVMEFYIIFDIGGTSIKYAVMDKAAEILEKGSYKTPMTDIDDFFNKIEVIIKQFSKQYNIIGIAISAPGAVDCESGIIGGDSAIRFIHGPSFKEELSKRTGLCVEIQNDANCAALAEVWMGAAKEAMDSLFIIIGTGIGGAIVKDKNIHHGYHTHGGEFGFVIMEYNIEKSEFITWSKSGSTIELVNSVCARKGLENGEIDGRRIFDLADAGDQDCIEELDKFYFRLAIGIHNLQYIYDPEVIVIGGGISEREEIILEINKHIDYILEKVGFAKVKPKVVRCHFGNAANMVGALYHYISRHERSVEGEA
jgi:predicted NBD/HSP70 family sugar kinase